MSHFRFLHLPRELRDVIYNHLIIPTKEIFAGVDEYDTVVTTTDVPTPALLPINKQIKSEYLDQLPSSRTLHVLGGHCSWWTGYPDLPGPLARSVKDCYVYIHVECYCDNMSEGEREEFEALGTQCDAVDFLHNYREALQPFLSQFPSLESVHLKIGLWGSEEATIDRDSEKDEEKGDFVPPISYHSDGFTEALSMLVALPLQVSDMEVVRCLSEEAYDSYRMGEDHGLPTYVTWTRAGGWRTGNLRASDR